MRHDGTFRLEAGLDGYEVTITCSCGESKVLDTLHERFSDHVLGFMRDHGVASRVVEAAWTRDRLHRLEKVRW